MQYWNRAAFYPGAFLWLVPRFSLFFLIFFAEGIIYKLLYLSAGQELTTPLSGWRRSIYNFVITNVSYTMVLLCGFKVEHIYHSVDQVDYSKYLGPDWKQNHFKGKRVSTIVSNHYGILDIFSFLSAHPCSFTPAGHVRRFPLLCGLVPFYTDVTQCVYVERDGSEEARNNTVKVIKDR